MLWEIMNSERVLLFIFIFIAFGTFCITSELPAPAALLSETSYACLQHNFTCLNKKIKVIVQQLCNPNCHHVENVLHS